MSIARNLTHWVIKQSDLHNTRQSSQRLQILPLRQIIIMQVQKLQTLQAGKHLRLRQRFKLVVRQIDFLKLGKRMQIS